MEENVVLVVIGAVLIASILGAFIVAASVINGLLSRREQ